VRDKDIPTHCVLGAGLSGLIFLGILFVILFHYSASIPTLIWSCAALTPIAFGGAGSFLFFLSSDKELDQTGRYSNLDILLIKILAYVSWVVAGMSLASIVLLKKDIRKTISISRASTRAIREVTFVPAIAMTQVIAFATVLCVMSFWTWMLAGSLKTVNQNTLVFGFDLAHTTQAYPEHVRYM
jgi:hypothetical protein